MKVLGFTWIAAGVLAAAPALARSSEEEPESSKEKSQAEHEVAECPSLFGDAETHETFAEHRELALRWVSQEEQTVTIVHSTEWDAPVPVEYEGIELTHAEPGEADVLVPEAAAEELGCPAGHYRLVIDDAVGPTGQVLAILEGLVLINEDGTLGVWIEEGHPEPRFEIAWTSTWGLSRPTKGGASTARAPISRPKPKR